MKSRELTFSAIGTNWHILVSQRVDLSEWSACAAAIQARIETFDKTYSRFRNDSLITRMAHEAGRFELPPDGFKLMQFYKQLYELTDGQVTPLIGQVMADAGYGAAYSFASKPLRQPPIWDDIISFDKHSIMLEKSALLDFGAAGKGYLIDLVGEKLGRANVTEYVINAGGDIMQHSASQVAVRVGLENPFDMSEALGIVRLSNASLCASAGSKRKWGNYHHIINPTTLKSTESIAASWVIAHNTMTADGLATALFFAEPAALQKRFAFSYATLSSDMELTYSPNFPAQIFEAVR